MDGLVYTIMQVATVLLIVGSITVPVFIGRIWRKQGKEY